MIVLREADQCRQYWWWYLLLISNFQTDTGYVPGGLGQLWILCCQFQCLIASVFLIIYPMWTSKFQWQPEQKMYKNLWNFAKGIWCWYVFFNLFLNLHLFLNFFSNDELHHQYTEWGYKAPWGIYGLPYIWGLKTGYILYATEDIPIKLSWKAITYCWIFHSVPAIVFLIGRFYEDITELCLPFWGLFLCWVTVASAHGYGGPVDAFLTWNFWSPIAKISFMTYVVHLPICWYYFAAQDYNVDFSSWLITETFMAQLLVELLLGFVFTLIMDLPFMKIQLMLNQALYQ